MDRHFDKIRNSGLKLTPRRMAIVGMFAKNNRHLTPEEVRDKLSREFRSCGLPGVYRNLETLTACGVLTRIQKFDGRKHYALCTSKREHHHHIVCVKCGRVDEITNCAVGGIKQLKGYKIVSHYMQINGICEKCCQA